MTRLRILVLGSYPAVHPRHGGQIRLAHLVAAYRARGWDVRQASFFPAHAFYMDAGTGPADVGLPHAQLQAWQGHAAPLIEDLASGDLVAGDEQKIERLEGFAGKVDVVHLEQPWLLPVVQQLRDRGALGPFSLVYGSQNVEHPLKRAIFEQYQVANGEPLLAGIEALERQCAQQASLVAAVTDEDAAVISGWTQAPVVSAANGVSPWQSDGATRSRWQARLGDEPFALYVASAHPPNVIGFCESFGESLASLSPLQKVVLAGSVAEHILKSDWFKSWGPLNQRRIFDAGVLADADLSALRDLAHAFVLPMVSGGGSNLKTAEALYTGKHVVATPHALRGFEAFCGLPGLQVVQPGPGFGKAVWSTLTQPLPPADAQALARRQALTWDKTLAPLCDAVAALEAVPV